MGRLRSALRKLEEQARQHHEVLVLPDGKQVRYTSEDMLGALSAAIRGEEEHWLLPAIRQVETNRGLPGLIRALERSRERVAQGDG
jgi:LmbE family N-acetylglucosaminyl deacetylase